MVTTVTSTGKLRFTRCRTERIRFRRQVIGLFAHELKNRCETFVASLDVAGHLERGIY